MKKIFLFFCFGGFFIVFSFACHARTIGTKQNVKQEISKKSWIITKALLEEIGVPFEEEKEEREKVSPKKFKRKIPPNKKLKRPEHKTEKQDLEENLFSDKDDDFMNDADKDLFASDDELFNSDGDKNPEDVMKSFGKTKKKIRAEYNQRKKQWEGDLQKTLKRWKKEQEEYFKRIDIYKANLVEVEILKPPPEITNKIKPKPPQETANKIRIKTHHTIPGTFDIPIRDQGGRGTCSSFTAIRAIETVLAQNRIQADLSEQYFYWASKPECQTALCSNGGSWWGHGLIRSRDSANHDIPLEISCPYEKGKVKGNETQIPLNSGCYAGKAKVTGFHGIKNSEILGELTKNKPVLGAYKLSPNFYRTKGLVTYEDSLKKGEKDSHAAGHAILLIGYIKLPVKYQKSEGTYCYITANSWSEGWGKGGYGCLTEKWLEAYTMYHMTVSSVEFDSP